MLKEFIKYKWRCISDEVQGGIILLGISIGIFLLCFLSSVLFDISIGDSFMFAILLICLFGVDCHNFTPVSIETVEFYRNAIENVYDEECFNQF